MLSGVIFPLDNGPPFCGDGDSAPIALMTSFQLLLRWPILTNVLLCLATTFMFSPQQAFPFLSTGQAESFCIFRRCFLSVLTILSLSHFSPSAFHISREKQAGHPCNTLLRYLLSQIPISWLLSVALRRTLGQEHNAPAFFPTFYNKDGPSFFLQQRVSRFWLRPQRMDFVVCFY